MITHVLAVSFPVPANTYRPCPFDLRFSAFDEGWKMTGAGLHEGDVLWIEPSHHNIPDVPGGLAFLVQDLLGWAEPDRAVWVRGIVIDPRTVAGRQLTLRVSTDQPRAVPRTPAPPPTPTTPVAATPDPTAPTRDDHGLIGPPAGFRRRIYT